MEIALRILAGWLGALFLGAAVYVATIAWKGAFTYHEWIVVILSLLIWTVAMCASLALIAASWHGAFIKELCK